MDELSYELDFFTPSDAPGVVLLFQAVYGDHYPVQSVYDPDQLIHQEETGDSYRIVARSSDKEIVGHISLYRSAPPNRELYEAGCLMVRHDYRQTDLSFTLFTALTTRLAPRHSIKMIWGEAVCNHLFTQQTAFREGFFETGLEMDLMPASSYTAPGAQSVGGRVAVLPVFRITGISPRLVYVPPCYDEFIRFLYDPFTSDCTFISAGDDAIPEGTTTGKVAINVEAGIARITLDSAGKDITDWIGEAMEKAEAAGAVVIQVFMRLTSPSIGQVVAILHRHQFFFGGILPCWFGDDGLLMQKIIGRPFFEGAHVYTKRAKKIKEYVMYDWNIRSC